MEAWLGGSRDAGRGRAPRQQRGCSWESVLRKLGTTCDGAAGRDCGYNGGAVVVMVGETSVGRFGSGAARFWGGGL